MPVKLIAQKVLLDNEESTFYNVCKITIIKQLLMIIGLQLVSVLAMVCEVWGITKFWCSETCAQIIHCIRQQTKAIKIEFIAICAICIAKEYKSMIIFYCLERQWLLLLYTRVAKSDISQWLQNTQSFNTVLLYPCQCYFWWLYGVTLLEHRAMEM